MYKSFSFKGIVHKADNLFTQEGDCLDILNLRIKDGSLQPMPKPKSVATLPYTYKSVYWHSMAKRYLCVTEKEGRVHIYDENFKSVDADSLQVTECATGVNRIEFTGNIVCFIADTAITYALFDTNRYKWLGERPKIPEFAITTESQVMRVVTDDKYYIGVAPDDTVASSYWSHASVGYYDEWVAKLNEQGCFVDRALFRYAFRLYDGSYICSSPVYYVEDRGSVDGMGIDSRNFYSEPNNPSDGYSTYTVKVQGFKPTFKFDKLDLGQWENVIVSIDVFASGSIPGHKVVSKGVVSSSHSNGVYTVKSDDYERYEYKKSGEIFDDVAKQALFYKVKEYSIFGVLQDECKDVSPSSLALSQSLGDDTIAHSSVTAAYSYLFNGRLHIANLRETLFKGYAADCYSLQGVEAKEVKAVMYTELNTTKGLSVVKKDFGDKFKVGYDNGKYYMTPYLMYPDIRATRMLFVVTVDGVSYKNEFKLTPHAALNYACYLNDSTQRVSVNVTWQFANANTKVIRYNRDNLLALFNNKNGAYTFVYNASGYWNCNDGGFDLSYEAGSVAFNSMLNVRGYIAAGDTITVNIANAGNNDELGIVAGIEIGEGWDVVSDSYHLDEKNVCDVRENVMKVSEVDNPFFFPSKQTYTPSSESIIAMCSNTVALSQGQFGQHPLYIFCSDGVWVMSTDSSGSFAYTTCYPLMREVCNNPSSVTGIDSGVVFSTDKGLLLISGGKVTSLSAAIDRVDDSSRSLQCCEPLQRVASVVSLQQNYMNGQAGFVRYLQNAVVGFLYSERELIVSNHEYGYSFVLSLDSGGWCRVNSCYKSFVNSYPSLMATIHANDKTTVAQWDCDDSGSNSFMLVTRPMLWGTKLHKRIMQMMLHASVKVGNLLGIFKGVACYLLCSNDGTNFKIISGSERRTDFCDMSFPYVPTQSYRYYMVAIVGNASCSSRITAIEVDVNTAWSNKLK